MVRPLSRTERATRAARVRWLISDVDGVLTPATAYYSAEGEQLKRFSLRDGMGVELLREGGVHTAFLSREDSPIVRRRAEKLGLERVFLGVRDKARALDSVLAECGVALEQVAYIGDDVNDLGVLLRVAEVGLTAAPADAVSAVSQVVHFCTAARGGEGAFREFADSILNWRQQEERP
jgi:3-deoxy-D-manno-octulosonate 8-phosphate phosphatase (KDO 8-P phosphatase)